MKFLDSPVEAAKQSYRGLGHISCSLPQLELVFVYHRNGDALGGRLETVEVGGRRILCETTDSGQSHIYGELLEDVPFSPEIRNPVVLESPVFAGRDDPSLPLVLLGYNRRIATERDAPNSAAICDLLDIDTIGKVEKAIREQLIAKGKRGELYSITSE